MTVASYTAIAPLHPVVFGPGQTAHAEPALAGWKLNVDELFIAR